MHNDSSSYSSDSYSRHTSRPDNKHDDSKLREKFAVVNGSPRGEKSGSHNPYRFTRSTANPVNVTQVDKAKLSDLSAKYRWGVFLSGDETPDACSILISFAFDSGKYFVFIYQEHLKALFSACEFDPVVITNIVYFYWNSVYQSKSNYDDILRFIL